MSEKARSSATESSEGQDGTTPESEPPPEVSESLARARRVALLAAEAGLEKKASNIQIIDVAGKVDYADFLVLMTGASDRNVAAIARGVDADLSRAGHHPVAIEGLNQARWVLIDFVDVVVHVFQEEWRGIYDLDGLWMDAGRIPFKPPRTGEG